MESSNLLSICGASFLGVFLLLTILAAVFRLITVLFPGRETIKDAAWVAAMNAAIGVIYPGTKITKVEEIK